MSITDSQQLSDIYFTYLYSFVWNCALLEFDQNTHEKERTDEEDLWATTKKKKKKKEKK